MQLCTNGVAAKKLLDQLGVLLQEDDHKILYWQKNWRHILLVCMNAPCDEVQPW